MMRMESSSVSVLSSRPRSEVYALSKCMCVLTKVGAASISFASMTFAPGYSEASIFGAILRYLPSSLMRMSSTPLWPRMRAF